MPTSDPQGKDWALQTYLKIKPQLVVDVGPGEGTYAKLMRPHHKAKSWTAIEAWAPYVTTYGLDEMYDRVIVADVNYVYFEALKSDLVIAGDVLEHMEAEDARSLLSRITMLAKNALISIPVLHLDQDAVNGNPFERHIDHWTYEAMLDELTPGVVDTWRGDVLAYYWWQRP